MGSIFILFHRNKNFNDFTLIKTLIETTLCILCDKIHILDKYFSLKNDKLKTLIQMKYVAFFFFFGFSLNNMQRWVSYRITPSPPFHNVLLYSHLIGKKNIFGVRNTLISYTQEIYQLTKTALEIKKRTCIDLFIKSSQAYTSLSYPDMQYFIIVSEREDV